MPRIKGTFSRRLLRRLWNQHGYQQVSQRMLNSLEQALLEHVDTLFDELKKAQGLSLGLTFWKNRLQYTVTYPWHSQTGWLLRYGSEQKKTQIIEMVWEIIYIDGKLDQHEDYLVHKLARLLRLSHKQLIEAKLKILHGRAG